MNPLEWLHPLWQQLLLRPFFVVAAAALGSNAVPLSDWFIRRTSARMAPEYAAECELQWLADFYDLPPWLRLQSSASIFFSSKILEGRRRESAAAEPRSVELVSLLASAKFDRNSRGDPSTTDFDFVTGMAGRRGFQKRVAKLGSRFRPGGCRLSVIVVGVDHFPSINGQLGRSGGDAVLREIGRRIRRTLRSRDYLGRVGLNSFAVALPNTTPLEAVGMAERLRSTCELSLMISCSSTLAVTGSVGLACKTDDRSVLDLLDLANAAAQHAQSGDRTGERVE